MICIRKRCLIIYSFAFLLAACMNTENKNEERHTDRQMVQEALAASNIELLSLENQEIEDFIQRHGLQAKKTGSGLRYSIIKEGDGPKASKDMTAVINYTIRLLTGDVIYNSDKDDPKEFRIGRGGVESGLEEGVLLLNKGDKAIFIMPAHLAHGVPGDGVKIPKRATIVYDIELIDLK